MVVGDDEDVRAFGRDSAHLMPPELLSRSPSAPNTMITRPVVKLLTAPRGVEEGIGLWPKST
jgi:hypothetical protein